MKSGAFVNVGRLDLATEAMGPGLRAALWVRGCPLRCRGCSTPELLSERPETRYSVEDIFSRIEESARTHHIEGVSFSGGEPFAQAEALAELAGRCRAIGLSVITWSGFTAKYLLGPHAPRGADKLIDASDILIDGPVVRSRIVGSPPLRGSDNQRAHFLTRRYTEADVSDRHAEVVVDAAGNITIQGVVPYEAVRALLHAFGIGEEGGDGP